MCQEEFLEPLGLTQYRVAKDLSVPARRINEIVHGNRAVSADTALRLARYFGTSDRFWLNLQDDGAGTIDLVNAVNTSQRVAVPIRFLGSTVEIRVPRAALGDTDGRFGMAYIVEMSDRPVSDFVPNAGHYAIAPPQP